MPEPSPPRRAAPVNGQKTDRLDLSFGLKILGNALAAFGASVPSLDVAYRRARKIQFAYANVTSTVVAPLEAGNYLAGGTLNSDNPVVKHYFMEPDSQAFVILDVLKSDSITVIATDEHGTEVGVDVPAIQGVVGAGVKVTPSGASQQHHHLFRCGARHIRLHRRRNPVRRREMVAERGGARRRAGLRDAVRPGGQATATASPILLGTGCRVRI